MIIEKLDKKDFDEVFCIMQQSFPSAEYRPKHKQYALLDNEKYNLYISKHQEKIQAFIAYWDLGDFFFAEHLAVAPQERNGGIGSRFMTSVLDSLNKPLVLEVENKNDGISKRRIGFYERLGLFLTDVCYNQPNFDNSDVVIPLRIMCYDIEGKLKIQEIERTIFEKIYKKT